jgi:hypothetical protein
MKVFLQQLGTGFFVGVNAPLVLEEVHARDFRTSLDAIDYCVATAITDVVVLLRFPDPHYDIRLHPFGREELLTPLRQFSSESERAACLDEAIARRVAEAGESLG